MKMVNRSCPVCGSKDQSKVFAEADFDLNQLDSFAFASRKLPEYMHYRLISCPTCDVLYASPIPELSEQDLRNWHIGKVRQISKICLFAGFMQSDAPYNRFLV